LRGHACGASMRRCNFTGFFVASGSVRRPRWPSRLPRVPWRARNPLVACRRTRRPRRPPGSASTASLASRHAGAMASAPPCPCPTRPAEARGAGSPSPHRRPTRRRWLEPWPRCQPIRPAPCPPASGSLIRAPCAGGPPTAGMAAACCERLRLEAHHRADGTGCCLFALVQSPTTKGKPGVELLYSTNRRCRHGGFHGPFRKARRPKAPRCSPRRQASCGTQTAWTSASAQMRPHAR
jgi:hypothetical protein